MSGITAREEGREFLFVGEKEGIPGLTRTHLIKLGIFFSGKYLAEIRRKDFPPRGKGPEK